MAYTSGAAATSVDILDAIRSFLSGQGWTVNRWAVVDTYQTLNLSYDFGSGVKYFNFQARSAEIRCSLSTGYAAASFGSQADETTYTRWQLHHAGSYVGYEVYYDSGIVFVPLEFESGGFSHLCFGEIAKYGTYTGGEFVDASNWMLLPATQADNPKDPFNHAPFYGYSSQNSAPGYFRCTALGDVFVVLDKSSTGNTAVTTGVFGFDSGALDHNPPNASTGRAILKPVEVFVRDYTNSKIHPVGYVPNVRMINIRDLSPKQNIDTDWYVYPLVKKGDPAAITSGDYNSGFHGYAIKRVV